MTSKQPHQIRHEKLIDFLSQFSQYSTEKGEPVLEKVAETRGSHNVSTIPIFDINMAVVAFTDVLNIGGGSIGNIDLYRLMQAYLRIPEYRDKFNALINEAESFHYNLKESR